MLGLVPPLQIREGASTYSSKVGNLQKGEIFTCIQEKRVGKTRRVKMERGWVSVTSKGGKPLCVNEEYVQKFLQTVPLLQHLTDKERAGVATVLEAEDFPAGAVIVTQGDDGDCMYFLETGSVQAEVLHTDTPRVAYGHTEADMKLDMFKSGDFNEANSVVMAYEAGDYFGEVALLMNTPRQATVRVTGTEPAKCLKLNRGAFEKYARGCKGILAERQRVYKQAKELQKAQRENERIRRTEERKEEQLRKIEERERERQQKEEEREATKQQKEMEKAEEREKQRIGRLSPKANEVGEASGGNSVI